MGVGAELSKGRPKYRLLKAVDLGDFRERFHWIVLDCVWVVFASQKWTLLIVSNLDENCCVCWPLCRLSGISATNSDVKAAICSERPIFKQFTT